MFRWPSRLPFLPNLAVTATLLLVAFWTMVALDYEGYCYGFSDGKTPCTFAEHARDSLGWFNALSFITLPLTALFGTVVFAANSVLYRALAAARLGSREAQPDRRGTTG